VKEYHGCGNAEYMRLQRQRDIAVKEKRHRSSKSAAGTEMNTQIPERAYGEFRLRVRIVDCQIDQGGNPDQHFETDAPVDKPRELLQCRSNLVQAAPPQLTPKDVALSCSVPENGALSSPGVTAAARLVKM
jgi:hypothetical protein